MSFILYVLGVFLVYLLFINTSISRLPGLNWHPKNPGSMENSSNINWQTAMAKWKKFSGEYLDKTFKISYSGYEKYRQEFAQKDNGSNFPEFTFKREISEVTSERILDYLPKLRIFNINSSYFSLREDGQISCFYNWCYPGPFESASDFVIIDREKLMLESLLTVRETEEAVTAVRLFEDLGGRVDAVCLGRGDLEDCQVVREENRWKVGGLWEFETDDWGRIIHFSSSSGASVKGFKEIISHSVPQAEHSRYAPS